MAVISELIRTEADGTISFGDYSLPEKKKLADFKCASDLYKVKTYKDITKLERNEMFVYESVPGSAVTSFKETADGAKFSVEAAGDVQITLEFEPETVYDVLVDGKDAGTIKTNLGGKLSISVELDAGKAVPVEVKRA